VRLITSGKVGRSIMERSGGGFAGKHSNGTDTLANDAGKMPKKWP
jgi:hypothetical protein